MTHKLQDKTNPVKVLESADPGRRQFLKTTILAAGFAVPVIQSFSIRELRAEDRNIYGGGRRRRRRRRLWPPES